MRKFSLTVLLLCAFVGSFAQIQPNEEPIMLGEAQPEWKEKLHYGGNIWAGFFGSFYLDASPMIGYDITKKGTVAGLGASLIYQGQWKGDGVFAGGPRLFVRQAIWRSFFAHAEYEMINAESDDFYGSNAINDNSRKWGGSPLVGAGLYQGGQGQQKGSFISVMYNLGYPDNGFISPQGLGGNQSPIVLRFGFFF